MKRPPSRVALAALVAGLALLHGLPATGQQSPESLLPPGFGDAPAPAPAAPAAPAAPRQGSGDVPAIALVPPPPPVIDAPPAPDGEGDEEESAGPVELPEWARRPIDTVGVLDSANSGLGADAFGDANGQFLSALMRRVEAPIASRWASILLRRALLSRVDTPRAVPPADWVAERAWLLLRMGEADGARMMVQAVDIDRYSPKLISVAAQVALATADPAGLCGLVGPAQTHSRERIWPLANAMCTALGGEAAQSSALIDQARRAKVARGIDLLLAEKVVGAGGGRRAINIEWDGVDRLTSWRFGLATALNVNIPQPLFDSVGLQVQAWRARAAMVPLAARIDAARTAAALGVFSNATLVDLYGALADETDPLEIAQSPAGRLRAAYVAASEEDRMSALRKLWDAHKDPRGAYGDAVLTARAAARIRPSADRTGDAPALIGAMLSAGLDLQADRWASVVQGMSGSKGDRAWAMLAVGTPDPHVELSYARVNTYAENAGSDGKHRARLLLAALAGLGRLSLGDSQRLAGEMGVPLGIQNRWTQAIDLAARRGQAGTVALLAAVGMQTGDWVGVPPAYLYHIISALRRVGREGDARMIAAEAVTRA